MSAGIGSLLITASEPSKEYLSTENFDIVNISDYPQLYNIFYNAPFINGYRQICTLPNTYIKKFGYNNGLYWCTDDKNLYYTSSLTSSWLTASKPNSSWNTTCIDCINNTWFFCGTYGGYGRIAYSTNLPSWSIMPTTISGLDNGYGPSEIYYLNSSYVFKIFEGTAIRFYQFTSLSNIYSSEAYFNYTTTPTVNISAANGKWYFSFDTHSGSIYHQIQNGTSTFSANSEIFSCSSNCGNIKAEYKNGTYYIITGDGIYSSSSPNSNFSLTSTNNLGSGYRLQTNGYWYGFNAYSNPISSIKRGMGFSVTKDFESFCFFCVNPIYSSSNYGQALYYNTQNNIMYAVINGILYINDNTQFMIPYYKMADDVCKTYIKAL